jgi:hypothetical protein
MRSAGTTVNAEIAESAENKERITILDAAPGKLVDVLSSAGSACSAFIVVVCHS